MFQDGVGAGKLAVEDLEPYYAALQETLRGACQFQIVVETFTQTGGAPLDLQPFSARPAPLDRIRRQLEMAARHSATPLVAFSAPEYMTPEGGPEAARLYEDYLMRVRYER
jgi:hypothetical protein